MPIADTAGAIAAEDVPTVTVTANPEGIALVANPTPGTAQVATEYNHNHTEKAPEPDLTAL